MTENRLSDIYALRESDLVVEAATQAALHEFAPSVLAAGKHFMVLSVGGLVGVLDDWARLAEKHGCRIPVEGECDRLSKEIENVPSENPRTGKLSYLSAVAMLRELGATVQVGN
jgi:aspartate dehydrogenase